MLHNIDDFRLTAKQLECKYDPDEDHSQHPMYRQWDWFQVVASDSTRLGYWDWVYLQLVKEQEELDRCNPYTQHLHLED